MKRTLIVRGGRPAHQPVETTEHFRDFLESAGFSIQVSDSPTIYSDKSVMSKIDLIIQCIESDIDEQSTQGLLNAVADGTGFVGWHGGVLVGFPRSEAYYQMIGGKFVAHPAKAPAERNGNEDDFFIPHTIEITPEGKLHPITQQLKDFELITEQYWILTDPYMHVLATTTQLTREGDPWDSEVTSPAMWVRKWGKGKIFICSPGHNLDVVKNDSVTTAIQNGLIWASR